MMGETPRYSGPKLDDAPTDLTLPKSTDVIVIGGGIVGMSTAVFLAERGVSVVVLEKGLPGSEQSGRNWGWVRRMGRDPRELPLMIETMRIWDQLSSTLGARLGFQRSGIMYLCKDEQELAKRAAWLRDVEEFDLDSHIIGSDGVSKLFPGLSTTWCGGLYTPGDGRAEPQAVVPALVRRARELGVIVVSNCAARVVGTSAGRISSVITEKTEISCSTVVVAAGAWSRLFCKNIGLTLPQLKVLSSAMRVDGVLNGPEPAALGSQFAFRKRIDGGYTIANSTASIADIVPDSFRFFRLFLPILRSEWKHTKLRIGRKFVEECQQPATWKADMVSPFECVRILDPWPDSRQLDIGLKDLCNFFPAFKAARIEHQWAGYIDVTPDAIPVISPVESKPGLYLSTGFSGHGFGIGPGAGRLVADLITGHRPIVDPAPFRFSRFTDGSNLALYIGL
jgi:glycine/D-amino acid oxidase-like deaminating enzyme